MRILLTLLLLAASLAVDAQPARLPRVGFVANTVPEKDLADRPRTHPVPRLIEEGLRELGWVDGKNVQLEWRTVEGRFERWPLVIDELVKLPVDVLVVFDTRQARIAMERTRTVPILLATNGRFAGTNLVQSMRRPGGNLTGISGPVDLEVWGKRLALMKEAFPEINRVVFLYQGDPGAKVSLVGVQEPARLLGISLFAQGFRDPQDVDGAVASAVRLGANGMILGQSPHMYWPDLQTRIHRAAERHRLPAMHAVLSAAESGGLMAYGDDGLNIYRRAPYYLDKLLRGAKPADLPVEQNARLEFAINLKAASVLGHTFPASVRLQADRVFE